MNVRPDPFLHALAQCQQAYRQHDTRTARHWAAQAVALQPTREEGWLWLANLASPRASVAYLNQALTINPRSERARKAMRWAVRRLRAETASRPAISHLQAIALPSATATPAVRPAHRWRAGLVRLAGAAWLLCLLALFAVGAWPIVQAAWNGEDPVAVAQVALGLPSATPTATATPLPTATFTATPIPTDTPVPTATPIPTETPPALGFPLPDVGAEEHWIDINLTEQSAAAYRGHELVKSFIVSTGTWQTPTVTGQYNIYVKYRYADMAGPGYYLPNVPYVMYFYEGYGLHGTYWHNNFGTPMSHGCVNFPTEDAGWVFDFVEVGTLVNVHY